MGLAMGQGGIEEGSAKIFSPGRPPRANLDFRKRKKTAKTVETKKEEEKKRRITDLHMPTAKGPANSV